MILRKFSKSLFTLLFLASFHPALAQKQANNWAFNNYELNFNHDPVDVTRVFASHLNRGMGIISDANGDLLFYTDGYTVWNRNHETMPNGLNLIPSHLSTSTQQSLVVPKPGDNTKYYIFTVDPWNGQSTSGLYYSEVDLQAAAGMGDVVTKGVLLVSNTTNKLSAVLHENRKDVWVIAHKHNANVYATLLITENGIASGITNQTIGPIHSFWGGQLKFSPDGKKAAVCYSDTSYGVSLFDFDASTGSLSNDRTFPFTNSPIFQGLDFSSDATKLYVYDLRSGLHQYDVSLQSEEDITNSRTQINMSYSGNDPRQFQLAPDGKIYMTKGGGGGGTGHLGVIENPNAKGEDVVAIGNGLYLEGGDSFVNYTPIFIQSYFFKTSFTFGHACERAVVNFQVTNDFLLDSVKWSFGEGSFSTQSSPQFHFQEPGNYTVKLIAYYPDNKSDTISQQITVDPVTPLHLGVDRVICAGSFIGPDQDFVSFQWSTGDTTQHIAVNQAGQYILTVTNEFVCLSKDTVNITINELPVVDLPDLIEWEEDDIQLDAGMFTSYVWNTGETTQQIDVTYPGWYSVLVEDEAGCRSAKSIHITDGRDEMIQELPSNWIQLNPRPNGDTGLGIFFIDHQIGFVINAHEILRTTDGGNTWTVQQKISSGKRIAFKDMIGYVVGDNGSIYKSTHKGEGWNKLEFEFTDDLNAITILHPDTLYVTSDTKLFISHNGGQSWTQREAGGGCTIGDSFFINTKVGHVACTNGGIFKTTDGGITWRMTESIPFFYRITFASPQVGYALRASDLFKTTDGGESWTYLAHQDVGYALQFMNEDVGFLAGEHGAIRKTVDGGVTWHWIGFDGLKADNHLYAIFFIDENHGFAAGMRGRIIETLNGGVSWEGYSSTYNRVTRVQMTSEDVGFMLVGNQFFKTTDEGVHWEAFSTPVADVKTEQFDFVNDDVGFAIVGGSVNSSGYSNSVFKTVNGGLTWSKAHSSSEIFDENLYTIHFIDENVGFVSGGFNYQGLLRTADGGQTWTFVLAKKIGQIQFVTPTVGFARTVGYYTNKIYKTIDGGLSWQEIYSIDDEIDAIHFVNQSHGFWAGGGGTMYKTTNGGTSWSSLAAPPGYFRSVKFLSENFGYVVDDYGHVYVTRDGGINWDLDLLRYGLISLELFGNRVFASGDFGMVFSNTIGNSDLLSLKPQLIMVTPHEASIACDVSSSLSLSNVPLILELGEEKGNYTQTFDVATLNGLARGSYNHLITGLDADKVYYYRFRAAIDVNNASVSPELAFLTGPLVTGVDSDHENSGLSIYPNPAHNFVQIRTESNSFRYQIRDITGKVIITGTASNLQPLDISQLEKGIYLFTVEYRTNRMISRRFVKL